MNADFSQLCILPPFNSLHAQLIRRGIEPEIVEEDENVSVEYRIPNNTTSVNKTNFWQYDQALFGVDLPPDVGLTGNSLAGTMALTGHNDWAATGIPITPIDDGGFLNAYPLATIEAKVQGNTVATTRAVVPVSWEIACNLCHAPGQPGPAVDADILAKHDQAHGTSLLGNGSVLCAACHADPALGAPGLPDVSAMSHAMHSSHASRVEVLQNQGMTNTCYACHPGYETNCQRDVHYAKGIFCTDCHGGMSDVGSPARRPWVDEPKCGDCHSRNEFEFEEPGQLFKDSHGHGNVHCAACHGSPHAITPALTVEDNIQAYEHQGYLGVISKCTVCHTSIPTNEGFEHKR
ncbi:MAG: hypothetical protein KDA57_04295 [Planctomycetales bacterium]|nr:hypothetical protein [Planctomycetales bacterium]